MLPLKKSAKLLAIAAAFSTITAGAQATGEERVVNDGYVVSKKTGQVVRDSDGQCWHTRFWTPEKATVIGCDGYTGEKPVEEIAIVPPPVIPQQEVRKFSIKADTLFAFDKFVLQPKGKQALDELFADLKDLHPTQGKIEVKGYADRIGNPGYNKRLSQKRADSVRAYLIAKGIPAHRIVAEGYGSADPVTKDTCKGTKRTKALIACLQPDRRVEIIVNGSHVATVTP